MQTLPPGYFACPRCRHGVLSGAPVCPNCGTAIRPVAARRSSSGIIVLLFGLLLVLVAAGGFALNCLTMVSNIGVSAGSERYAPIFQLCIGTAAVGLLVMLLGLIIAIVQLTRRD
jgi:hypothetical protein